MAENWRVVDTGLASPVRNIALKVLEGTTLVTGDLVRAHQGGRLNLLPDAKLRDRALAVASVRRLLEHERVDAVLPGDGWPIFRNGRDALKELVANLDTTKD